MFASAPKVLDLILSLQPEEWVFISGTLSGIVGGIIKLSHFFHGDACKGYGYCRFNVLVKQMELIRRTLSPLKGEIKRDFALDLRKTKLDTKAITSRIFDQCVKAQNTLIKAAFSDGEWELINMVIKNDIPEAGTSERKEYIDENFPVFENAVWNYTGEKWDDETHILEYNDRYEVYKNKRERFILMFDNFLTEARKIGKEAKHGKKKKKHS